MPVTHSRAVDLSGNYIIKLSISENLFLSLKSISRKLHVFLFLLRRINTEPCLFVCIFLFFPRGDCIEPNGPRKSRIAYFNENSKVLVFFFSNKNFCCCSKVVFCAILLEKTTVFRFVFLSF